MPEVSTIQESDWKQYFDRKAGTHGASVKSSDYFDDASFFTQRNHLLHWVGPLKGKTVLDAGCGVGAFSEPLTSENTVHGVDFSAKSLEYAAKRGLHPVVADLKELPFAAATFDVVFCIGVVQLIADYEPVVRELARVTKPGGILLIQTLHGGSLQRKVLGWFERSRKFDRMYSMRELEAVFVRLGFGSIAFLKQYHPLGVVSHGGTGGSLTDRLCTSFAIRGTRQLG